MTDGELDAIYASLPRLACRQLCGSFCGPIAMGPHEWTRLVEHAGMTPSAETLMRHLRCPFLTDIGNCAVYAARPLVCRLWGTVKDSMQCPHGCEPDRWLSTDEAWALLRAVGVDVQRPHEVAV